MAHSTGPFAEDDHRIAAERGVHPGSIAFERQQARSQQYASAQTPEEFARLLAEDPFQSDSMRQLLTDYRNNPDGFELRNGQLVPKPGWTRFLPAAVGSFIGASALGAGLGAGGAAGASGGGASSVPTVGGSLGLGQLSVPTAPGFGAAASAGIPAAAGAGGLGAAGTAAGSAGGVGALDRVLGGGGEGISSVGNWLSNNWQDLAGLGLGAGAAFSGRGEPESAEALNRILGMAENRVNATNPLFNQLVNMAGAQMPIYTRENR